jgi:hypothetical protein
MSTRPSAVARLADPDAVLTRGDLRELGYERRAVDAIFRAVPVEVWPGYSRPMIRVSDFLGGASSSPTAGIACVRHDGGVRWARREKAPGRCRGERRSARTRST